MESGYKNLKLGTALDGDLIELIMYFKYIVHEPTEESALLLHKSCKGGK